MSLDNVEDSIKVIVVGDGSVGKTSMLRRFCKGDYSDQYKKTIGTEFSEKDVYIKATGQTVKLMLWDTAGQEVFNALTSAYYRGSGAAIIAFSTVDRDSFVNVDKWKKKVEAQCGNITMVLCQTKCDLLSDPAAVKGEEVDQLAKKLRIPLFRTSTKENFNVVQLFEFTAEKALNNGGAAADSDIAPAATTAPAVAATTAPSPEAPRKEAAWTTESPQQAQTAPPAAAPAAVNLRNPPKKPKKSGGFCTML